MNNKPVTLIYTDPKGKINPAQPIVIDRLGVKEFNSPVHQGIMDWVQDRLIPKNVKYDVECILDWEDNLCEVRVYALNPDLPRTYDESLTCTLNGLLRSSIHGRSNFGLTTFQNFLKNHCRVPYLNINMM